MASVSAWKRKLLLGLLLWIAVTPAFAEDDADEAPPLYKPAKRLALLQDEAIRESSGLARCITRPGLFWTHNDSGDQPRLFLFDEAGITVATYTIPAAEAIDWEDLCSFHFEQTNYVLIGDVGDNAGRRKSVKLYLVEEPSADQLERPQTGELHLAQTIELTFEGGPRDCEAIAVDPFAGQVYLVSKQVAMKCSVYQLPLLPEDDGQSRVAKEVAEIELPIAVAMDIAPDASRAVVLTYFEAFEYRRQGDEPLIAALGRPARRLVMPRRKQGESICYGHDGRSLYLTSEGVRQPFWKVQTTSQ